MRQNRPSPEPPVMTWRKAGPVLAVAGLFDAGQIFFQLFWFFGPALAAIYCTSTATDWVGSLWGLTASACGLVGVAAGVAASAVTIPFGVVMAMAVGLTGFLSLGLWIVRTNARIFKANATGALWFGGSLVISELPLIGALPALSLVLWKLYRTQIRVEGKAHAKWKKEQAETLRQEREQQTARLMRIQTAQVAEADQQAANEAVYAEDANDEIPEEVRRAA